MRRLLPPVLALVCLALTTLMPLRARAQEGKPASGAKGNFRAGAAAVDIAPGKFPVVVNGGFLKAQATRLNDPIQAKCVVLDDGTTRLAIVVVDSCMMPRELLDRAKDLAKEKTGIPTERMLISATHTHSAPSTMGGARHAARCRLRCDPPRADRRIDRARQSQPRAGPRRLGCC